MDSTTFKVPECWSFLNASPLNVSALGTLGLHLQGGWDHGEGEWGAERVSPDHPPPGGSGRWRSPLWNILNHRRRDGLQFHGSRRVPSLYPHLQHGRDDRRCFKELFVMRG